MRRGRLLTAGLCLAGLAGMVMMILTVHPAAARPGGIVAGLPHVQSGEPVAIVRFVQTFIDQRVIIRIPARGSSPTAFLPSDPRRSSRSTPVVRWKERKAPRCVSARSLLAIQAVQRDSIDLVTHDNQHLRARLAGECRASDFYQGFYLNRSEDGYICQDRDILHSRAGTQCVIDRFRLLVPRRDDEKE